MTLEEAAEMIGLTWEDIADERWVDVAIMFWELGFSLRLQDKTTGNLVYVFDGPGEVER